MTDWADWIGKEEVRADDVAPAMVARWCATLDRQVTANGAVPQGLHWCLCLPDAPTGSLGADGHPARDDTAASFLPPVPLPRRMWAGSDVRFLRPLRPGMAVTRRSRIASIRGKQGATGPLVFVDLDHVLSDADGDVLHERQTLVYRAAVSVATPVPSAPAVPFDPADWDAHRLLVPDAVLLFRYSALTFNSHRIHYDAPYAIGEEGYGGCVVHGPLIATLLLDLAQRTDGDNRLSRFSFRAQSPALSGAPLHLGLRRGGDGLTLAAFAGDGRAIMAAEAIMGDPISGH